MKPELKFGRAATLALVLGSVGLGGALSGCGKVGPLEQPAPLLGAENKRDYYRVIAEEDSARIGMMKERSLSAGPVASAA